MHTLAVLISGRGSNLQALIDACAEKDFPARIGVVISSHPGAKGLERAEAAGLPAKLIHYKDYKSRDAFDSVVEEALQEAQVDTVCLAGFMRLFGQPFSESWLGRTINIHPSLLPSFPGLRVQKMAVDAGVRISGCSVFYVTPEMDAGPIIGQAAVPVWPDDDGDTLADRILEMEHQLYPACVRLVAEGKVWFEDGKARFADPASAPVLFADPGRTAPPAR